MAKYLEFDRKFYGTNGMIPLFRGDDWKLTGKVIELDGANRNEVDLSGVTGMTCFFPKDGGGALDGVITIEDADCGKIKLSLAGDISASAALSDAGISPYIELQDVNGTETILSQDDALNIRERGFQSI